MQALPKNEGTVTCNAQVSSHQQWQRIKKWGISMANGRRTCQGQCSRTIGSEGAKGKGRRGYRTSTAELDLGSIDNTIEVQVQTYAILSFRSGVIGSTDCNEKPMRQLWVLKGRRGRQKRVEIQWTSVDRCMVRDIIIIFLPYYGTFKVAL